MSVPVLLSLREPLGVLDLHNEDIFVTSGHPDQVSLLSGTAPGPRLGFEVNVENRD